MLFYLRVCPQTSRFSIGNSVRSFVQFEMNFKIRNRILHYPEYLFSHFLLHTVTIGQWRTEMPSIGISLNMDIISFMPDAKINFFERNVSLMKYEFKASFSLARLCQTAEERYCIILLTLVVLPSAAISSGFSVLSDKVMRIRRLAVTRFATINNQDMSQRPAQSHPQKSPNNFLRLLSHQNILDLSFNPGFFYSSV